MRRSSSLAGLRKEREQLHVWNEDIRSRDSRERQEVVDARLDAESGLGAAQDHGPPLQGAPAAACMD